MNVRATAPCGLSLVLARERRGRPRSEARSLHACLGREWEGEGAGREEGRNEELRLEERRGGVFAARHYWLAVVKSLLPQVSLPYSTAMYLVILVRHQQLPCRPQPDKFPGCRQCLPITKSAAMRYEILKSAPRVPKNHEILVRNVEFFRRCKRQELNSNEVLIPVSFEFRGKGCILKGKGSVPMS